MDVFAWSYEDLKTYDKKIIQHKIPLKEGIKPHRQNFIQINPLLLAPIEKEVKELLQAKIIVPLRYSDLVFNLVPMRKKNREIILCVDFHNLNRASLKDNYPLPKMDYVLQKVTGAYRILWLIDSLSIIKWKLKNKIRRRQHSQPPGAPSCMQGCHLVL